MYEVTKYDVQRKGEGDDLQWSSLFMSGLNPDAMNKERGAALTCREGDEENIQQDLYIGCEKFPQEVISSVNYSGFG